MYLGTGTYIGTPGAGLQHTKRFVRHRFDIRSITGERINFQLISIAQDSVVLIGFLNDSRLVVVWKEFVFRNDGGFGTIRRRIFFPTKSKRTRRTVGCHLKLNQSLIVFSHLRFEYDTQQAVTMVFYRRCRCGSVHRL